MTVYELIQELTNYDAEDDVEFRVYSDKYEFECEIAGTSTFLGFPIDETGYFNDSNRVDNKYGNNKTVIIDVEF